MHDVPSLDEPWRTAPALRAALSHACHRAGRAHIESIWLPSVLCADDVSWSERDAAHPHARFRAHGGTAGVDYVIHEDGRPFLPLFRAGAIPRVAGFIISLAAATSSRRDASAATPWSTLGNAIGGVFFVAIIKCSHVMQSGGAREKSAEQPARA